MSLPKNWKNNLWNKVFKKITDQEIISGSF